MKKLIPLLTGAIMLLSLAACGGQGESRTGETLIRLSDSGVTVDGSAASESADSAVYLSHDIVYYEDRDSYDSGNAYGEGTAADRHTAEEAAAHTVVNITKAGTYRLSGQLSAGQIAVDLGNRMAANMVMLGFVCECFGMIQKEDLISVVKEHVPARFVELNVQAVEAGVSYARDNGMYFRG